MSSDRAKYNEIRTLRNYNYHKGVSGFIAFLNTSKNQEHRQMMIEAMGWFKLSREKSQIIDACKAIEANPEEPEEIRKEAKRTLLRLS